MTVLPFPAHECKVCRHKCAQEEMRYDDSGFTHYYNCPKCDNAILAESRRTKEVKPVVPKALWMK